MSQNNEAPRKPLSVLAHELSAYEGDDTLNLVERVVEQGERPTLASVFGTAHGTNVFGDLYPPDMEAVSNKVLDADIFKTPGNQLARAYKQAQSALDNFRKAKENAEKKSKLLARKGVRETEGGSKLVKEYIRLINAKSLDLFSAGEPISRITYGSSTHVIVGVQAPELSIDLRNIIASVTDTAQLAQYLKDQLVMAQGMLIDHTFAVVGAVSHDKVLRCVELNGGVVWNGDLFTLKGEIAGDKTQWLEIRQVGNPDGYAEGMGYIRPTVEYRVSTSKKNIDQVIEDLSMFDKDLDVFYGHSQPLPRVEDELVEEEPEPEDEPVVEAAPEETPELTEASPDDVLGDLFAEESAPAPEPQKAAPELDFSSLFNR